METATRHSNGSLRELDFSTRHRQKLDHSSVMPLFCRSDLCRTVLIALTQHKLSNHLRHTSHTSINLDVVQMLGDSSLKRENTARSNRRMQRPRSLEWASYRSYFSIRDTWLGGSPIGLWSNLFGFLIMSLCHMMFPLLLVLVPDDFAIVKE